MAITLPNNFVKQYNSNLHILTQLMGNKFAGKCREESIQGEEQYFDTLGNTVAGLRDSQFPTSPTSSIAHDRRQVKATAYHNGLFVDRIEKVKTLCDPESAYPQQQIKALNRKRDQEFFKGALGTAVTGVAGGGTAPVTGCPVVDVATGDTGDTTGMNLDKLIEALYKLEASGVDVEDPMDKPYFVWTPKQKNELLKNTKVTSTDYATVKALVTGQINSFYGFEFISSTLVPYTDEAGTGVNLSWSATTDAPVLDPNTDVRCCFAYTKNNIIQATNPEITTEIEKRADHSFDWYAYSLIRTGAVRMEENKVVLVPCDEDLVNNEA